MAKGLMGLLLPKSPEEKEADAHRAVLRQAAKIGGTVFGPIPKGVRREFFCLDTHTWVWHEEWTDEQKVHHVRTTRYDIRPNGIYKAQDGQAYQKISRDEALNLYEAATAYVQAVDAFFIPRLAPGY